MNDENSPFAVIPQNHVAEDETHDSGDGESSAAPPERAEFTFPGDVASVPESREQLMHFVDRHCCDEAARIDILVALQEALINATLHGCRDDAAKQIQCAIVVSPSDIIIMIRDPGAGFDLAHWPTPSPTSVPH